MLKVYIRISLFLVVLIVFGGTSFGQTTCTTTTCITVNSSTDDTEEWESGWIYHASRDLELVFDDDYPNQDHRGNQTVGIRFNSVDVPQGAIITNAFIQFTADPKVTQTEQENGGNNVDPCSLTIYGEDVDNAATFDTNTLFSISNRTKTSANIVWNPPLWPTPGDRSSNQKTVDISPIIQEIVDRPGYSINNSIVIVVTGTGRRTAAAYDGTPHKAPQLCITYEYTAANCGPDYLYAHGWQGGTDPNGNATNVENILIKYGDATINSNTISNSVIVNPEASLIINSGVSLTANNITLESTSTNFSSLISDGTINATVNYKRYTASVGPIGTNDLISAPVTGQTFGSFATTNSNLAASSNIRAFAPFVNLGSPPGAYSNFIVGTNDAEILDAGTGYRAATTDGSPLIFTGAVNTGPVFVSIVDGSGSPWNLIGNPFPSYIDFELFFPANSVQFDPDTAYQAIYGYDGSASDGWTVWNQSKIDDDINYPELLLNPGQGFFVRAKVGAGTVQDDTQISFTPTMRTTGLSDDFIAGRTSSVNVALSKLKMTKGSNIFSTDIYFNSNATRNLDSGYDAGAFQGNALGIFTSLVEGNVGVELAIQALPFEDFNDVVVPLGIKAAAGEQISISIDDSSTLPESINVYLEDNVASTLNLLNFGDYTLTPSEDLTNTGRFFIHFTSSTLSLEDKETNYLQIYTSANPKSLFVNGLLTEKTTVAIFDLQGRLVLNRSLDTNGYSNEIDISTISTGIYVVKVKMGDITKTQKIIIN